MLTFKGETSMAFLFFFAKIFDQHDDLCVTDAIFLPLMGVRHWALGVRCWASGVRPQINTCWSENFEACQIFHMLKNASLEWIISPDIPCGWTIIGPYNL